MKKRYHRRLAFIALLSGISRAKRLKAIKAKRKHRDTIAHLDQLESQVEELRDKATGIERIRCINDLFYCRSMRRMKGV